MLAVTVWKTWEMAALRHTYARQFIEMRGRLEELQKSLGYSSILTTEQAYGHLSEDAAASLARQRIYATPALASPPPARARVAHLRQVR